MKTFIRRAYMTLPARFDAALELLPGFAMVAGGLIMIVGGLPH